ncbi:MAG: class I SAM-dependent methyltransferase [Rhizobacter sp.]|nr:class I SAM-dependent methyltransferase [Chlorobiales bacterium]
MLAVSPITDTLTRRWETFRVQDTEPTLESPVSQLVTRSQCDSPIYREWCNIMKIDPEGQYLRYDRKLWEWVYILQALRLKGMFSEGKRGLGFGVGNEPLTAVMAKYGSEIVATDMPHEAALEEGWAAWEQHAKELADLNSARICDADQFKRLVEYRVLDMRRIDQELTGFDFVWSSCSLEHLGSLEAGAAFVLESLRCLKPGGVAVHTTEFNLSSDLITLTEGGVSLYRRRDILALAEQIEKKGYRITLNLHAGTHEMDKHYDLPPFRQADHHLKLLFEMFITTSIGLIIEAPQLADGASEQP